MLKRFFCVDETNGDPPPVGTSVAGRNEAAVDGA